MKLILAAWAMLVMAIHCQADTVTLNNGGTLECTIEQEQKDTLLLQYGRGLISLPRSMVKSVARSASPNTIDKTGGDEASVKDQGAVDPRMPSWKSVISKVAQQKWAADLQQIPTTVIDAGVLRNVPYKSHRCGIDYEFNVYGDPDAPAGFEIGIYRALLSDDSAKQKCIDTVCELLPDPKDAAIVRLLDRDADKITRGELTFEITPPTAEDAYGGWWISVYNEAALESSRASTKEIEEITQTIERTAEQPAEPVQKRTASKPIAVTSLDADDRWSSSDLRYARPYRAAKHRSSSESSSGGGRVYVRSYYRKDGTYVRAHTRRR